jgi:hypothetical protein
MQRPAGGGEKCEAALATVRPIQPAEDQHVSGDAGVAVVVI